ncbi:MAG: hypothetical protein ABW198_08530 [Pseudorhodoplanes sp.]
MKIVHEMRQRRAFEPPKSTSPLPVILGAVIAFGIGLLGVSGVIKMPALNQGPKTMAIGVPVGPTEKALVVIEAGSHRTGRAETAPLIKACIPLERLGIARDQKIESGDVYRLLWAASSMSRVAAVAGIKQKAVDDVEFTAVWADVADCVYRQNGWVLCDPDNRALAVEAANTFMRQFSAAQKADKPDPKDPRAIMKSGANRDYILQNAQSAKARILDGLRNQVAEGRLISSDFGMFAPAEVLQVVRDTKPLRDSCAKRG